MTILRMDTDAVEDTGRQILSRSTDLMKEVENLRYSSRILADSWESDSARYLCESFSDLIGRLERQVDLLDDLYQRVIREEQEWLQADNQGTKFSAYYQLEYDWKDLPGDVLKVGGALYIISKLHGIPARPYSIPIHGPAWLLEKVGFGAHQRIMRPETITKQFMKSSAPVIGGGIAGVTDGVYTGVDSYRYGEYSGTSRAVPAAIVDGVVKGAMTGLVTAGLIFAASALTVGAAPVVAGAAVIGTCVVGGFVLDKFLVDPVFKAFQGSQVHHEVVEGATQIGNQVQNFVSYGAQKGVIQVRSAFDRFIKALQPAAVGADAGS